MSIKAGEDQRERIDEIQKFWDEMEACHISFSGLSAQVLTSIKTKNLDAIRADLIETLEVATEFLDKSLKEHP